MLERGRAQGQLAYQALALHVARMLVSCLERAMMLARIRGDAHSFDHVAKRLEGDLVAPRNASGVFAN